MSFIPMQRRKRSSQACWVRLVRCGATDEGSPWEAIPQTSVQHKLQHSPSCSGPGKTLEAQVPCLTGWPGTAQAGSPSQKACPNAMSPPKLVTLASPRDLQRETVLQGQSLCHQTPTFHSSPFRHFVSVPFWTQICVPGHHKKPWCPFQPMGQASPPQPGWDLHLPRAEKVSCLPRTTQNPPQTTQPHFRAAQSVPSRCTIRSELLSSHASDCPVDKKRLRHPAGKAPGASCGGRVSAPQRKICPTSVLLWLRQGVESWLPSLQKTW